MRSLYQTAATLAAPLLSYVLARRAKQGKEDPARLSERKGIASLPRPSGPLIWIHAASNGEAMSALPLVEKLIDTHATRSVLLTTGTVTSARLIASRLPERAIHQFVPLDRPAWVKSFLQHWRPDLGIWIESEFWPSLIWEMRDTGRPLALVNGRISPRSLSRWKKRSGLAQDLLSGFSPCIAQTEEDAENLKKLGAIDPVCVGNLKLAGAPLTANLAALEQFQGMVGSRPIWVAASTHPGEEDVILDAHKIIARTLPNVLTILVPRHPRRRSEIISLAKDQNLSICSRSNDAVLSESTAIYLADTLGELGLFYRAAPISFIGGTLTGSHGGHNPLEAAHLECHVLHGPDMRNFDTIAADLSDLGIADCVANAAEIAKHVIDRLTRHGDTPEFEGNERSELTQKGAETLGAVLEHLRPVLNRIEAT